MATVNLLLNSQPANQCVWMTTNITLLSQILQYSRFGTSHVNSLCSGLGLHIFWLSYVGYDNIIIALQQFCNTRPVCLRQQTARVKSLWLLCYNALQCHLARSCKKNGSKDITMQELEKELQQGDRARRKQQGGTFVRTDCFRSQ